MRKFGTLWNEELFYLSFRSLWVYEITEESPLWECIKNYIFELIDPYVIISRKDNYWNILLTDKFHLPWVKHHPIKCIKIKYSAFIVIIIIIRTLSKQRHLEAQSKLCSKTMRSLWLKIMFFVDISCVFIIFWMGREGSSYPIIK